MNPQTNANHIQYISLVLSILSFIFSSYLIFRYRRRHLRQKLTEMSLAHALDKIKMAHIAWLNLANSMHYFAYLCNLEDEKENGNGKGWTVKEETGSESFNVYHDGKIAMLDLLYGFSDTHDPLLTQIFKKEEIEEICSKIKEYQPFTLYSMTRVYRADKYMAMLDDILSVNSQIKRAIARQ